MQEQQDILFLLGEMSGKLDGVIAQTSTVNASLVAHASEDAARFQRTHEEIDEVRNRQTYWAGGIAVGAAILAVFGQFILTRLFG